MTTCDDVAPSQEDESAAPTGPPKVIAFQAVSNTDSVPNRPTTIGFYSASNRGSMTLCSAILNCLLNTAGTLGISLVGYPRILRTLQPSGSSIPNRLNSSCRQSSTKVGEWAESTRSTMLSHG